MTRAAGRGRGAVAGTRCGLREGKVPPLARLHCSSSPPLLHPRPTPCALSLSCRTPPSRRRARATRTRRDPSPAQHLVCCASAQPTAPFVTDPNARRGGSRVELRAPRRRPCQHSYLYGALPPSPQDRPDPLTHLQDLPPTAMFPCVCPTLTAPRPCPHHGRRRPLLMCIDPCKGRADRLMCLQPHHGNGVFFSVNRTGAKGAGSGGSGRREQ